MSLYNRIAAKYPDLKKDLWVAQINLTPENYIKEKFRSTLIISGMLTILTFFMFSKMNLPIILVILAFIVYFFLIFKVFFKTVKAKITKRQKKIDEEVLFAGRFLLVKLHSGKPLINALMDASDSYGVASQYFKDIIRDIDTGTPLEEALDKAASYSPSKRMRKILFQINNALKIGIDVTQTLESILDQISSEQLLEIDRYGKKLNSVTMFYMLLAIVLPSLGLTMFVVVASMINIGADLTLFLAIAFFLIIIELIFLSIFKSIRPNVNI
ncbi:MAG: type II secretion system F family protein [Nanoarchaeota archaeon]|nr:type II secretion system F family protein [Nanoarchaeota archaeon]MBU1030669.1 type II secretion system F family protein [Nanoarchaeota archaeon]MBU1850740.1 type II secretion system F family protein [Nanoarchaeota archaeon]